MKKVLGTVLLSFLFNFAPAQVVIALLFGDKLNTGKLEFGLVVSPAFTNFTNTVSNARSGLNLALYFNIHPDNKFFLHVEGVGKGAFGAKDIIPYPTGNDTLDHLFSTGSVERKIQIFSMPVLVRYKMTDLFFAEVGIQPSLRLKAKDFFNTKIMENDLDYTIKVTKELPRLDFGVAGGLFYKFRKDKKSMGLGIRYYYGLIDFNKTQEGTQSNTAWLLNVTIPVGTGKSSANTAK
ncbi:PorT family protein [Chitinophagaceae bacterium LB-8]|uniref:PorT family protein n=1 Tax=Paraflavisolibacter caeni TaxID=2982496 RepID=A0A9X2Y0I8_9BACT|nr:outer membrane beta-barrel protein [Paraflavisolibacter caeni]MCU7552312.1 PorT family protein [Paraflavisolibacter caeni]